MASRRRLRRAKERNPEEVLVFAQIEAAALQGRRGSRRRLAKAEAAYASRVVGTTGLDLGGVA